MKYNAHIYCKAWYFLYVLMQSLKTSLALLTIIITFSTCRGVLFYKQKLLNRLLITHDPRLRTHCISSDPLTPPRGRLTGVKLGQEIHREYDFHSLHCVYQDRLLTFSHIKLEIYLEPTRRERYNGVRVIQDRVIMESQCTTVIL